MAGSWTDEDKRKIFEVFAALAFALKSYGNQDHRGRLRAWQMILENDMTADEVCAAMIAHSKVSEELPTPSQLLEYKHPPEKQITYAEYKHALVQHEVEGFPMFGYYGQVIKDYERQRNDETGIKSFYEILESRKQLSIAPELKQVLQNTIKRIEEKEPNHDK